VTKLFTNYAWCIEEIRATPSILQPLFSFETADFGEMFNNEMHLHVIRKYLASSRVEREGRIKKGKKLQ